MPTIDKAFLLRLILLVFALTVSLWGLHQLQAERIPEALLRQAQRAEEEHRPDAAIHYYRQYLEFRNEDVEARIRLAQLLRQRHSNGRALAEVLFLYDQVLHADPQRHEIRREALATALRIGRYSDALVHAETLLEVFPDEPLLWQQLGAAQAGLNRLSEARRCYEKAVQLAPYELLAYQRLAQLLWRNLNEPLAAREVLERMVAALPADPEAHLTRARFELYLAEAGSAGGGDSEVALRHLQRVYELDPENIEATLLLADIYQRRFRWDVAQYLLREARNLYPRELRVVRAASWLEVSRGNIPTAIATLEEGLRQLPETQDLLIPLADLLIQQGDKARTAEILQRLQSHSSATIPRRYLQIRLAMRDQNWSEALRLIDQLQPEVQRLTALGVQLHLLRAVCAEQLGEREEAEKALQSVLLVEPHNVQALHGLGQLYLDSGRFTDAARVWEQAAHSPYASGPIVAHWVRFQAHLLQRREGKAEEWRRLEQVAEQATNRFPPSSSEPIVLQTEVLRAQGRYSEAVQRLRRELGRRPNDIPLWMALIHTTAEWQGSTAALGVAEEAQAACGDQADIRLSHGLFMVSEPGRLRPLSPLCQHLESWPDGDQIRLFHGLLDVFEVAEDTSQVIALLEQLATRRPRDPTLWLRLYQKGVQNGYKAVAQKAYQMLLTQQGPEGEHVLLCMAYGADRSATSALLSRLSSRFGPLPQQPDAALVLARLHQQMEQPDLAARILATAFERHPTHFAVTCEWLRHLLIHKDIAATERVVQRLCYDPRWGVLAIRRLILGLLASLPAEQRVMAIDLLRPLVERQAGGISWLGEVAARWQLPQTTSLLREAAQSTRANADDWLRAALLLGAEQIQAARRTLPGSSYAASLALLREAVPASATSQSSITQLESAEERRAYIQTLLSLKLSRQRPQEAITLIEEYLQHHAQERSERIWAQRQLALLHVMQGTESGRKQAAALLEQTRDDLSATAAELRASAQVFATLSRFLDGEARQQVLQRTAAALDAAWRKSQAPKDLYDLAQLYRLMGQRSESRRCLQTLLNSDPDNLHYLIAALEELIQSEDYAAAETFAKRLELRHGDDWRAITVLARFWCRSGQVDKAHQWVERYAYAADGNSGDYWTRLGQVASLLDELVRLPQVRDTSAGQAMIQAAAERYASLVPQRPEAAIGLAGLLAYAGRVDQALEQLQRLESYLSPPVRAGAGLALIRNAQVSEAVASRVLQWIDQCLQQQPQNLTVRLYRAEYYALRHELEQAVREYEALLREFPDQIIVLNNLAWILAADPHQAQKALQFVNRAIQRVGLTGDLLDTRARARISLKQFAEAEQDLQEALRLEATGLRHFHRAILYLEQSPALMVQAQEAFAQALKQGLDQRHIHPADQSLFSKLQKAHTAAQK
jgi:tetratricopeptide (TPR) repeat protein